MTARIGMDAGVVRQAASAIDSTARDLDHVVGSVNGLVGEIAGNWFGEAATEFHENWVHRYRGALTALVAALHDYAHKARTNADAQDRASSMAGAGSAGVGGAGARVGGAGSGGGGWGAWLSPVALAGPGLLSLMEAAPPDVGRYPKSWEKLLKAAPQSWNNVLKHAPAGFQRQFADLPDDVLRYKRFGIVHDLNDLRGFVSAAGKVSEGVDIASHGYDIAQDLRSHDLVSAGFDGAHAAAGALKSSKLGAVGYLGGAALETWTQVGEEARQVDWSWHGMSEVMQASPSDWASAFGDSVKQMPGRLLKIFG